ncbi:RnfABCDGE type electron transport complex subunit D [Lentisalinibacter orientalis]|uniref:RnfABCDGE type electron transport complex subunit D n=1 Tax=Lentisalinibacter orientalis TaxID=2992241 RepID=UPI003869B2F5
MRFRTVGLPLLRPRTGVGAVMRQVLYALAPAAAAYVWFFGPGLLFNVLVAAVFCLGSEALVLRLRGMPVAPALEDYSAVVTAVLLAFALPPLTPWWVTATGSIFAMVFAKHLYGGLGYNVFNPAMAGYVAALLSFPVAMTAWLPPRMGDLDYEGLSLLESLGYVLAGRLPDGVTLDAITRATPLDSVREGLREMQIFAEIRSNPLFGDFGGRGWEWIDNFIALGGFWLLYRGIIRWHIPVAVLAGVLVPATVASILQPGLAPTPGFHLFSGATLLCAFFIATDPVSAATSPAGRLVYGFGIGLVTWAIRTWGGYPDGVAFAVLLMNMAVPAIDRYTRPRIAGHGRSP